MLALGFLIAAAVCALISLGAIVFRRKHPEKARRLVLFHYATLICVLGYLYAGPTMNLAYYKRRIPPQRPPKQNEPVGYAWEKLPSPATTKPTSTPTLDERRAANAREFEELRHVGEALRLRKRDLLRSNVAGNREYVVDLALYNQALAKATEERDALENAPPK